MNGGAEHAVLCCADADEPGSGAVLLPPAQPALLTLTADGVIRIWVEVTLTPPSPSASASTTPKRSPEQPKSPQQVPFPQPR